ESLQAAEGRAARKIVAGEIEVLRDGPPPTLRTRPVAAQQRALVRPLARIAQGKLHAVAGGEEQGRRLAVPQQAARLALVALSLETAFSFQSGRASLSAARSGM